MKFMTATSPQLQEECKWRSSRLRLCINTLLMSLMLIWIWRLRSKPSDWHSPVSPRSPSCWVLDVEVIYSAWFKSSTLLSGGKIVGIKVLHLIFTCTHHVHSYFLNNGSSGYKRSLCPIWKFMKITKSVFKNLFVFGKTLRNHSQAR